MEGFGYEIWIGFASSSNKPFFQGPSCLHSRLGACLYKYIPNTMEGDIQVQKPLGLGGCIGHYRGHFLSKVSLTLGY